MIIKKLLILTCGLLLITSTFLSAQAPDSTAVLAGDSTPVREEVFHYVKLNRDTIFGIRAGLGPYDAGHRADHVNELLKEISRGENIQVDSFRLSTDGEYMVISYKDQPLYYVSEEDANLVGKTKEDAAGTYLSAIRTAFAKNLESRTPAYWLARVGFTLLSILGLVVILVLLNRVYRWGDHRLERYEKGIKRKRKSIFRYLLPQSKKSVFGLLLKLIRIALIIVILFFYLPFMFSFLPWTEHVVAQFYGYLAKPVKDVLRGLLQFVPNLVYIFVIVIITRYILRVFSYLANEIEEERLVLKGFYKDWAQPTFTIVKIILLAFAMVFIFPYLPGSDSPAFRGVSIFLGVLFSLGSTSAIANIVAGIVITYMRPFSVGDRVQIGQSIGDVMERNLLVTRLRTIKNEDITIPNALIINSHLWNFSSNASELGIILHTSVTIGYDVPSETVTELLLKAAENTRNLTRDFKPFVLQKSLNDFYVEYELNVYTKQPKKMAFFYSELHKSIREEFNKAGVEIMSPHYSAYRDGNASTIPPDLPGDKPKPRKPAPEDPKPPSNPVEQIIDKVTGSTKSKS
jgi:small-conductance mechanosensitive channel